MNHGPIWVSNLGLLKLVHILDDVDRLGHPLFIRDAERVLSRGLFDDGIRGEFVILLVLTGG